MTATSTSSPRIGGRCTIPASSGRAHTRSKDKGPHHVPGCLLLVCLGFSIVNTFRFSIQLHCPFVEAVRARLEQMGTWASVPLDDERHHEPSSHNRMFKTTPSACRPRTFWLLRSGSRTTGRHFHSRPARSVSNYALGGGLAVAATVAATALVDLDVPTLPAETRTLKGADVSRLFFQTAHHPAEYRTIFGYEG